MVMQVEAAILDKVNPVKSTPWWRANVKSNQNWRDYMNKARKVKLRWVGVSSLQCNQQRADQDAIYSIDGALLEKHL